MRRLIQIAMFVALTFLALAPCFSQANPNLQTYFKDYIGLSDGEIRDIRGGRAVAKTLRSRTPDEIFVFTAQKCARSCAGQRTLDPHSLSYHVGVLKSRTRVE